MRWLLNSQMLILLILNASLSVAGESPSMLPKDPTAQTQENSAHDANTDAAVNQMTLDQAVNEGVKSNLDILAARYGVPLSEADEITAGLWSNPAILFDTVFQPLQSGNWNQTNAGGPRQYDIIVSYPLDLSGKRGKAEKSAHEAVNIAKATFEDALRLKIQDIRIAYIEVIAQEHQLSLTQEKELTLKNLVTMTENRVGHSGRLPLLQMRAQLAWSQARLDTRQREISLRSADVQLSTLLARPPGSLRLSTQTKLRDFKLAKIPRREVLVDTALKTRPDLKALQLSSHKADLDTDLAKAQVWDNFNLTAGVSRQGPTDANPNDSSSTSLGSATSWNAGITIPLPFFNHSQGNIKKAELTKAQADKQIDSKILAIHQEIDGLFDQIQLGSALIQDYEGSQLKRARQVRDAQQRQFGTGNSGLLDYLDAMSAYQSTVSAYYDAVADYQRNMTKLNASVGKDFQ
jgi:cobalt-zinc-cadmium efflux system outer membrane protein